MLSTISTSIPVTPFDACRTTRPFRFSSLPRRRNPRCLRAEQQPVDETPPTVEETKAEEKKAVYIDDLKQPTRTPLSKEMRNRMRDEYVGLGGTENVAMGANWFLYIGLFIAALAILSRLTGAI